MVRAQEADMLIGVPNDPYTMAVIRLLTSLGRSMTFVMLPMNSALTCSIPCVRSVAHDRYYRGLTDIRAYIEATSRPDEITIP